MQFRTDGDCVRRVANAVFMRWYSRAVCGVYISRQRADERCLAIKISPRASACESRRWFQVGSSRQANGNANGLDPQLGRTASFRASSASSSSSSIVTCAARSSTPCRNYVKITLPVRGGIGTYVRLHVHDPYAEKAWKWAARHAELVRRHGNADSVG